MPDTDTNTLLLVDMGLQGLGALCAAGFVVWLARRGRWRDPLAGVECAGGPALPHLAIVVVTYVLAQRACLSLLAGSIDLGTAAEPGSGSWHTLQTIDAVAKLLSCAVIVVVLVQNRSFPAGREPRLGVFGVAFVGLLGALIITVLCSLQLKMTEILSAWAFPQYELPVHDVLISLHESAWGRWGAAHLFVMALIVAPVAEELFFRGLLLGALWRAVRRPWLAVTLSGLAFGLTHFTQPQAVLALATMGVALGYIRLRTGSLAACILVHMLFNARPMIFAWLNPEMVQLAP